MALTLKEIEARLKAIVANRTEAQGRRVIGVEAAVLDRLLPHLEAVVRALEARLADVTRDAWSKARDVQLARWLQETVLAGLKPETLAQALARELAALAQDEDAAAGGIISFDGRISRAGFVGLSAAQAEALVERPLQGFLLRTHLDKLAQATTDKLHAAVVQGWIFGESHPEIADRFQVVLQGRRQDAVALAQTWTQEVANRARWEAINKSRNVVVGVEWSAALDRRTCSRCGALHGAVYYFDPPPKGQVSTGDMPAGVGGYRPPLHFRCRCSLVPLTRSWAESLGIADEAGLRKVEARYAGYTAQAGQLRASPDFWDYLKRQPVEVQVDHLGRTRWEMVRAGLIDYHDILDGQGRLRRVEELETLARRRKAA